MDGHGPIEPPHRLPQAQIQQVFERPIEHAEFVRQRHRSVPFLEGHADVEVQRPVGLGGHHAGFDPQVAIALVHHHEVTLRLAGDVIERLARQACRIAEGEPMIDVRGVGSPNASGCPASSSEKCAG